MFFIGGFNTVLPHLLYISLIWAFLIIGLSGKFNTLRSGKAIQTENSKTYHKNNNTTHYFLRIPDTKDRENGDVPFYFRFTERVVTSTPAEIARVIPEIHRPWLSSPFRGPPRVG